MTFLSVGRNLEANAPQIQSQCPLRISMHLAKQAATAYPGDLPPAIAHACRLCCSPSIEVSIPTGEVVCACEFALVISFASVDDSSAAAALHHGPEHAEAPREVSKMCVPASVGLPCFAADPKSEVEHYFSIYIIYIYIIEF